ncbi:MAG TPA: Glu/Leu/Phe/Val dehydrogenase dimerization domain-containing protein, partial [Longimicrobiales bacterium]|nr:Glu/Leu/Phe/Val dehydrogenase dimerization domain-containing protein [Longimicrobiales bacterium]
MAPRPSPFVDRIQEWDGLGVVVRHDRPTGTWIFVALHDDTLGRPTGGCRMRVYGHPSEGLRDALRLAEGMTRKWAVIDLPYGGGKAVLAVPRPLQGEERRGLLRRFGELLESLKGAFSTGEDLGTTPADMACLATVTRWVKATGVRGGEPVDPGPYTALGVLEGIRAALAAAFGDGELAGRTVLVQGVGDVGEPLARMLSAEGARLLLSDLDHGRVESLAGELQARPVSPDEVYWTACDVYAPCAVGATLNSGTIPQLRCRVVAGSANNQLETEADADALRERGILYAPDYVVNGGGALALG